MTNLNNNEITVRFRFLNAGRKLKANYKPRTGNFTITGTIIEHETLDVEHSQISSVLVSNEAKGGRATICFTSREEATMYITMINNVLAVNKNAQIKILTSNEIRYNNENGKSLTIFNPDIIELDEIKKPFIGNVTPRTAPIDETIPFNYEEVLDKVALIRKEAPPQEGVIVRKTSFTKRPKPSHKSPELASPPSFNTNKTVVKGKTTIPNIDKELLAQVIEMAGGLKAFSQLSETEVGQLKRNIALLAV